MDEAGAERRPTEDEQMEDVPAAETANGAAEPAPEVCAVLSEMLLVTVVGHASLPLVKESAHLMQYLTCCSSGCASVPVHGRYVLLRMEYLHFSDVPF